MRWTKRKRRFCRIIAIARQPDGFRAVLMQNSPTGPQLLHCTTCPANTDWQTAYQQLTQALPAAEHPSAQPTQTVVAFDSADVVFYQINLPAVQGKDLESMIKLQAEALLPLPADQIQLAWHTQPPRDNQIALTIAAARTDRLHSFLELLRPVKPSRLILDAEALVEFATNFCPGSSIEGVLANIDRHRTQLCFAQAGRLLAAATLDAGLDDLSPAGRPAPPAAEQFVQDIRSALQLFGSADDKQLPIYILSNGSAALTQAADYLAQAGFNIHTVSPQRTGPITACAVSTETIFEYLVPIGLALKAFKADGEYLDLFADLYAHTRPDWPAHPSAAIKRASLLAAAALLVFALVSYALDKATLRFFEKHLRDTQDRPGINTVVAAQQLKAAVAAHRPDVLDLLTTISASRPGAVTLDTLTFRKGQPVNMTGQASSYDELYRFQEQLQKHKIIRDIRILNPTFDDKKGKVSFTLTLRYGYFSNPTAVK